MIENRAHREGDHTRLLLFLSDLITLPSAQMNNTLLMNLSEGMVYG
jgi:hypothetical protein